MLIALTGYMGSGKSTVGALVADALGCPFIDLDEVIARKAGRSIPEIFEAEGERGFRRLEKQALEKTIDKYAENTPDWKARPPAARSPGKALPNASPTGNPSTKPPHT